SFLFFKNLLYLYKSHVYIILLLKHEESPRGNLRDFFMRCQSCTFERIETHAYIFDTAASQNPCSFSGFDGCIFTTCSSSRVFFCRANDAKPACWWANSNAICAFYNSTTNGCFRNKCLPDMDHIDFNWKKPDFL